MADRLSEDSFPETLFEPGALRNLSWALDRGSRPDELHVSSARHEFDLVSAYARPALIAIIVRFCVKKASLSACKARSPKRRLILPRTEGDCEHVNQYPRISMPPQSVASGVCKIECSCCLSVERKAVPNMEEMAGGRIR